MTLRMRNLLLELLTMTAGALLSMPAVRARTSTELARQRSPGGSKGRRPLHGHSRDLLADRAAPVVCPPAEADRVWLGRKRRVRQVRQVARWRLEVVARGGHVVR